jgi:hypothetical protein
MIVTTRSGNKYIVKTRFLHTPVCKESVDEYGRNHIIFWTEHTTRVSITQLTNAKLASEVTVCGIARCHYKDKFDKNFGKKLAYQNAIDRMTDLQLISAGDRIDLYTFNLDAATYTAPEIPSCEEEAKV